MLVADEPASLVHRRSGDASSVRERHPRSPLPGLGGQQRERWLRAANFNTGLERGQRRQATVAELSRAPVVAGGVG
jgi:hypothetical protein